MTNPTQPETGALSADNAALVEREFPHWVKQFGAGYWTMKPASLNRLLNAARLAALSTTPAETGGARVEETKGVKALRDQIAIQSSKGTWDYNEYMRGMANGLIVALSNFTGEDPVFLAAPPSRPTVEAEDYYPSHEALCDLVSLQSEHWALNGGGPGWSKRWEEALRLAEEIVRVEP